MMTGLKSSIIRFKALGLHWRGARLLAFEVYDRHGTLKGVRPLGGSIEFGETAKDAVVREFKEEINVDLSVAGGPIILENVFCHDGQSRHEILFISTLKSHRELSTHINAFDFRKTAAPG